MESTTLGDLLTTVVEEEGNDVVIISSYVVPIVFALIFITGLIGNGLLVIIVLRNNALRASTPNIFIVSLALGKLNNTSTQSYIKSRMHVHTHIHIHTHVCK